MWVCVFAQQRNSNARRAVTDKFYFPNEGGTLIVLRARAPNQISQQKHTRIRKHTSDAQIIYLNLRAAQLLWLCGLSGARGCFVSRFVPALLIRWQLHLASFNLERAAVDAGQLKTQSAH